jgi:hypothetical protein
MLALLDQLSEERQSKELEDDIPEAEDWNLHWNLCRISTDWLSQNRLHRWF